MQTDARFDPGMSGGPVFNKDGQICAVVSTGMPPEYEGGEHYSHASLIWPVFGVRFNDDQQTEKNTPRFLRSEAEAGRIQAFNLAYMSVLPGDNCDILHFASPVVQH
jgi:hypothetical protein